MHHWKFALDNYFQIPEVMANIDNRKTPRVFIKRNKGTRGRRKAGEVEGVKETYLTPEPLSSLVFGFFLTSMTMCFGRADVSWVLMRIDCMYSLQCCA